MTIKLPSAKKWRGLFWATRTRILLWYTLIITFIFIVSIPAFERLLFARVDERVRRDLNEEMQAFNLLIQNEAESGVDEAELEEESNSDVEKKLDNNLKRPSSRKELKDFFTKFLARRLPEDENFLITFVDEKFYQSSPRARPDIFDEDSRLMRRWAKAVTPQRGERELPYQLKEKALSDSKIPHK